MGCFKSTSKQKKHGVQFIEAIETFSDPQGLQFIDVAHTSKDETRYYWIGRTSTGRILTTYFTKRGTIIRIISSAEWRKFRRLYERTQVK